jgi:hypothetical protein
MHLLTKKAAQPKFWNEKHVTSDKTKALRGFAQGFFRRWDPLRKSKVLLLC